MMICNEHFPRLESVKKVLNSLFLQQTAVSISLCTKKVDTLCLSRSSSLILILRRWGRRMPLVVFLFIAGVGCVGTAVGVIGVRCIITIFSVHKHLHSPFKNVQEEVKP